MALTKVKDLLKKWFIQNIFVVVINWYYKIAREWFFFLLTLWLFFRLDISYFDFKSAHWLSLIRNMSPESLIKINELLLYLWYIMKKQIKFFIVLLLPLLTINYAFYFIIILQLIIQKYSDRSNFIPNILEVLYFCCFFYYTINKTGDNKEKAPFEN